ncbi:MAG: IS1182 family transposase [Ktedonobacteraceae bacterium]|nr:IS1182 family transposase [Ktedonobacteraceae bacterium]
MSMKPQPLDPIPEETAQVARKAFPKGTLPMHLRDALGSVYHDEEFADLFATRGRGAYSPWRLAVVTVLQRVYNLTDRQAAEEVAGRLDWKYALSLPLEDAGFDFSVLCEFRDRLVNHDAVERLLGPIVRLGVERGWLKARGHQRTDSTHVLAAVRRLSWLEAAGETMRLALTALAEQEEAWLRTVLDPGWLDRYVHRFEQARFPKAQRAQQGLEQQVGQDILALLLHVRAASTPQRIRDLPALRLLEQVFAQHYEQHEERAQWRDDPPFGAQERIATPHDVHARYSHKRETTWVGYKVHLRETCDQEPHLPHLIVAVHTSRATVPDSAVSEQMLEELGRAQPGATHWYVDAGYLHAGVLEQQAHQQIEVVGPVAPRPGRKQAQGYDQSAFAIDWEAQQVRCPQGKISWKWHQKQEGPQASILVRFAPQDCQPCPQRTHCTTGKQRCLELLPREKFEALEQRRQQQDQPAFRQAYARRAGVEGTVAQGVIRMGLRRCRSRKGDDYAHLHHVSIAAAMNLVRLDAFVIAQAQGAPARRPRPPSPLQRLEERLRGA